MGVTVGNFYSDEFNQQVAAGRLIPDVAPDDVTNLRKLLAGRIDLFPIDQEVGQYLIARNFPPRLAQQLEPQSKSFWVAPLHVVIWRKHRQGRSWWSVSIAA